MRAVWIPRYGKANVLEVRDTPDPVPGPGEVLIRVRAAGLNFAEITARQGLYPDAPKPPCIVGYEVSGTVEQLGNGVSGLHIGARVFAMCRFGGHAELAVARADHVVPMPERMSYEEGAALPVNYITAHHILFRAAQLHPGDHVLIHMAAGGVGTALIQLAKTVPDVVLYGTASMAKHAFLRTLGLDHPIDYRTHDYVDVVRGLVGERGLDLVLDPKGGRDWKRGYGLLRSSGTLVAYGLANVISGARRNPFHVLRQVIGTPWFNPIRLMSDNRGVVGVNLGHLWHESALIRLEMERILELYEQNKFRPVIDRAYPFDQAADAHSRLEAHENIGKVLLIP